VSWLTLSRRADYRRKGASHVAQGVIGGAMHHPAPLAIQSLALQTLVKEGAKPVTSLETLIAKEDIRELVMLYSRGVDREDIALLRTLYTADGWDSHGPYFDGPAADYLTFLERQLPHMHIGGHNICNHLVSVDGDTGEGEVYAIAWHLIPDGADGLKHDIQAVRYIDSYRREAGRWRFARRTVSFDMQLVLPAGDHGDKPDTEKDPSYHVLTSTLFGRRAKS
jgi:SnoaL-like domain